MASPVHESADLLRRLAGGSLHEAAGHIGDVAHLLGTQPHGTVLAALALLEARFMPGDFVAASQALCAVADYVTADAMIARARVLYPRDGYVALEYARIPQRSQDFPAAAERFQEIRALHPHQIVYCVEAARCCLQAGNVDAAAAVLTDAAARFGDDVQILSLHVDVARRRGQQEAALALCTRIAGLAPDTLSAYVEASKALRDLRRFDEAEAWLRRAQQRFGDVPPVLMDLAWLSFIRGDLAATRLRWGQMRAAHPAMEIGYLQGLRLALQMGDTADAYALVTAAQAHVDLSLDQRAEMGVALLVLQRWDDAVVFWQSFIDHSRACALGYAAAAFAHRTLGRVDAASVLHAAAHRRPALSGLLPAAPQPYGALAQVFRHYNDLDGAELVLREGCDRFPDEPWLHRDLADLAVRAGRWADAISRWTEHGTRYGADVAARLSDLRGRLAAQETALAEAGGGLSTVTRRQTGSEADRDVMMAFESLGGLVTGCEFGDVQRAFGAEPLGLLRWSGMAMHSLVDLLERRFESIGEVLTTRLGYYNLPDRREYAVTDLTFGISLHTHVYEDEADEPTAFAQVTRRMRFLRGKLLDDLAAGGKIFLFKNSVRAPLPEEAERLSAAMRSYGSGVLLMVTSATAEHPAGTVRAWTGNLWVGHVDFAGDSALAPAEAWLGLCRSVLDLFRNRSITGEAARG